MHHQLNNGRTRAGDETMRPLTKTNRLARAAIILLTIPYSAFGVVTSDDVGTHQTIPGELPFGVNLDGVALVAFHVPDATTVDELLPYCSAALISDRHVRLYRHVACGYAHLPERDAADPHRAIDSQCPGRI